MSLSIFITGGSSGIGQALADYYLAQGHTVGIFGRDDKKFDYFKNNSKAFCYKGDVVNKEEVHAAIGEFNKEHGLSIVIASAGLSFAKKTQIPNFEVSRKIIDVNLGGVLNTFEAALKIMLPKKSGHLVAISSVSALCGFPGVSAYSAAKSAVAKLCEGYGIDLAPFGIKTTCICPGFVKTPLTDLNHHSMPFIMPAEKAARLIARAVEKEKPYYIFPWFFGRVLTFLSVIPRPLYRLLMRFYHFDYAQAPKSF